MALYTAKGFDSLLGTPGFSDTLLKNHFTLYQGYVTNTNKLVDELAQLAKDGKLGTPAYAELKRRFGWEFNGMRLHEVYFGNMSKQPKAVDKSSALHRQISGDFGTLDDWGKDFKATGAMRGIGWAAVYWDPVARRLFNVWVNEHDVGHLSGCPLVLIMDVFEHAFVFDYGLKRADYIEAFFNAIDWEVVQGRYNAALKAS
jgi:Fe-Mn family superoxide dismutase